MYLERSPSSWDFTWGVEVDGAPSRSLTICKLVNRKWQRKSDRKWRVSGHAYSAVEEREILIDALLSSSLILDFDAILDYSVDGFIFSSSLPDPKVLVLFEPSDWLTRLSRNWFSKRIIKKVISWAITYAFRIYDSKRKNYSLSASTGFSEPPSLLPAIVND